MNDFIAFNEQRAEFYWWMSSLFAKELTEQDIQHYSSNQMQHYLALLAETPFLTTSVNGFNQLCQLQKQREDGQLELAADFCELFLTTDKIGALPYASLYLEKEKLLNGKPAKQMAVWMEKYQMGQSQDHNEPLDHLALMLDFLGNLIILANRETEQSQQETMMQEQEKFIRAMLVSWVKTFATGVKQKDQFGFYAAASDLLVQFIELDLAFLAGE